HGQLAGPWGDHSRKRPFVGDQPLRPRRLLQERKVLSIYPQQWLWHWRRRSRRPGWSVRRSAWGSAPHEELPERRRRVVVRPRVLRRRGRTGLSLLRRWSRWRT